MSLSLGFVVIYLVKYLFILFYVVLNCDEGDGDEDGQEEI